MDYHLTIEEHPGWLHACVTGDHNAENAARFLREAYEACAAKGISAVLLEMHFRGPSLESGEIFKVVSQGSATGKLLHRIAYVDGAKRDPEKVKFAETVARNRGVNVRVFKGLEEARAWMAQP